MPALARRLALLWRRGRLTRQQGQQGQPHQTAEQTARGEAECPKLARLPLQPAPVRLAWGAWLRLPVRLAWMVWVVWRVWLAGAATHRQQSRAAALR